MISITTPAPLWATGNPSKHDRQWKPKPDEFALFARAVAARYGSQADQFAIMNEPNQPGWLAPQSNKRRLLRAPPLPRDGARGVPRDPRGEPARHDPRRRARRQRQRQPRARTPRSGRLPSCAPSAASTGRSARSARDAAAASSAPRADAIGHHPYNFFQSPSTPLAATATTPRSATAAGCSGSSTGWSGAGAWSRRAGRSSTSTTRSSATRPTRPTRTPGISLKRQDRWLQEAAKVAWATPRVRTYSQFRLTDGPVLPGGGFDAYREFQTGLMFRDMRKKPSYASFRHPFVIKRRGKRLRLWGQVRPGGRHDVTIERKRGGALEAGRALATTRRGYWQRGIRKRSGTYRYRWGAGKSRTSDAHPRPLAACNVSCRIRGVPSGRRSYLHEHMFPTALQRLRLSLKGGVALAVEFATLGELVPEYREPELPGDDSGRSAGRLIREQARPAVRPSTAAARARLQQRGTVTAVEPECAERLRAPSRQPRRRRPSPPVPAQPCV